MKTFISSLTAGLFGMVFLFLTVAPAHAMTFKSNQNVTIPAGQTIEGSLFVSGSAIDIEGTVKGDLFCAGQNVRIRGTIDGDVLCASQTLNINGHVTGDVRALAQSVSLSGTVDKNMSTASQQFEIAEGGKIQGEAHMGAQNASINGAIGKELLGGAQQMTLNGPVGGTVRVGTEELTVSDQAKINGNLEYTSNNQARVLAPGAILGKVTQHKPERQSRTSAVRSEAVRDAFRVGKIFSIIMYIILAMAMLALMPSRLPSALTVMQTRAGKAFGFGLLILFLTPIAILLFFVTIVGIPFALFLLMAYILAIYLSRILVAVIVGQLLIKRFIPEKSDNNFWTVVVGVLSAWILFQIPVIGGILSFLSILWGLGGIYYLVRPESVAHSKTK